MFTSGGVGQRVYHSAASYRDTSGVLTIFVRLRGVQDGYIFLSQTTHVEDVSLYWIILGSHKNTLSWIRRGKDQRATKFRIDTPGIMSGDEWRGFLFKYYGRGGADNAGRLSVYYEGSGLELMSWHDPSPLDINWVSFSTYKTCDLEIAYDCQARDSYSTANAFKGQDRKSVV